MLLSFSDLKNEFNRVLLARGVAAETADACAEMFARTTESGVYSHGVNRFPRFIQQLENGDIIPDALPKRITSLGAIEQWDAQRSIGNLTAKKMMDRAIELASDHGIGLVAVGSRDPNRFFPGMGTLFLRMMGEAFAAALGRFQDGAAGRAIAPS